MTDHSTTTEDARTEPQTDRDDAAEPDRGETAVGTRDAADGDATEVSGRATPDSGDVIYETRPTLKPTLIVFGLAAAVWAALVVTLWRNPGLLGTPEITGVVEIVVHLVFAFVAIRLGVRLYVLKRMRYQVTDDHVAREYALLYRYRRREVPIEQIRATEVRRDPLETILGYGTLTVLTAGVNRSLGFVEFSNVPHPEAVRDAVDVARGRDR